MTKNNLYHNQSMWKGASPEVFQKAQLLRERMTEAEKSLWENLKSNKLDGYKFRRQHPIHKFIADFYCHKLKLIIEVDGKYHENQEQKIQDNERSELLSFQCIKVIRFTNKEVISDIDVVLRNIREEIQIINSKK